MNNAINFDAMFSGSIGKDYYLLKQICPLATHMSQLVGMEVTQYPSNPEHILQVIELGGGTGITTLSILSAREKLKVISIDNEPVMQHQAKLHLHDWTVTDKLNFLCLDGLSALRSIDSNSIDIFASAYTLHNFISDYRNDVINEIVRILKPGGQFINGDRYALDDFSAHTRLIQEEVRGYFNVLVNLQKIDQLEQWIVHLFNDESENHIMRETYALQQLKRAGFTDIKLSHRMQVNALVTAIKPND